MNLWIELYWIGYFVALLLHGYYQIRNQIEEESKVTLGNLIFVILTSFFSWVIVVITLGVLIMEHKIFNIIIWRKKNGK